MASQVVDSLTDDLDGSPASTTVSFSLEGTTFEVDLTAQHADQLRDVLRPYIQHGRRLVGPKAVPAHITKLPPSRQTLKAWAASRGIEIPVHGRVPQSIIDAFEQAHDDREH